MYKFCDAHNGPGCSFTSRLLLAHTRTINELSNFLSFHKTVFEIHFVKSTYHDEAPVSTEIM